MNILLFSLEEKFLTSMPINKNKNYIHNTKDLLMFRFKILKKKDISSFLDKCYSKNKSLSPKIIKLNIKKKILNFFQNLKFNISEPLYFDYYGKSDCKCKRKMQKFIYKIDSNLKYNLIYDFIKKLIQEVCKSINKDYCWLTIRVTPPCNSFDIPRWHSDGNYWKADEDLQIKFIITLKGPSTLIVNPKKNIRKSFMNTIFNNQLKNENRLKKNIIVSNEKIIKVKTLFNGIIIISSNSKLATIHSEPPLTENRIFISILPMNKTQFIDFKERNSII